METTGTGEKSGPMVGSVVVSLFPSLSAVNTTKAVRSQALKSEKRWENIDSRWLRLYSFWTWPDQEPSRQEIKELMSIILEISVRYIFENFIYTFGSQSFLQ